MRKSDWRSVLGRKSGAAADRLDAEVERIVKSLRQGKAVKLPGVGVLVPGKQTRLVVPKRRRLAPLERTPAMRAGIQEIQPGEDAAPPEPAWVLYKPWLLHGTPLWSKLGGR